MELWADESESARLSGMTEDKFVKHIKLLEAEGFPKKSTWNAKRYRPAIIAFWHKQNGLDALLESPGAAQHGEDGFDRFGTNGTEQGIGRASR